jgi:diguanylate cyclase (GGDEF)-like protein
MASMDGCRVLAGGPPKAERRRLRRWRARDEVSAGNHLPPKKRRDNGRRAADEARAEVEVEASLEGDQSASDLHQTASDADQSASDSDQTASELDQAQAETDQIASDRDQAAADRDFAADDGPDSVSKAEHESSRVDREKGTLGREATAARRAQTSFDRASIAALRDETARMRDLTAKARDEAADARDRAAAELERARGARGGPATATRDRAAADRERAAADRADAAADRERAARDREQALSELHDAHLDELTGVHRRGAGTAALQQEIDRAQRSDGRLIMAFVDVDGLKSVNDSEGHAAGDALLRAVAAAIRSHLRSYDPIVRFGGDEFVCALSESDLDAARRRFEGISEMLAESRQSASISFGLAPLCPGDSLEDLVARADAALQLARTER